MKIRIPDEIFSIPLANPPRARGGSQIHYSHRHAPSRPAGCAARGRVIWNGLTGFIYQCVQDEYLIRHPDHQEIEHYLCGPPVMVDAVGRMLDSLGVEEERIAFDQFG